MLDMTLAEIMTSRLVSVTPETGCSAALITMAAERISAVVVVDQGAPAGILTERDIIAKALAGFDFAAHTVGQAMTAPVVTGLADTSLEAACALVIEKSIRHIAVVDATGVATGIVTLSDMVDALGFDFFCVNALVSQVMATDMTTAPRAFALAEAVAAMLERKQSCILVAENNLPLGIISERDLALRVVDGQGFDHATVKDAMSSPVETVPYNATVDKVLMYMKQKHVRRVVVVDTDRSIVGLLTQWNIINSLSLLG